VTAARHKQRIVAKRALRVGSRYSRTIGIVALLLAGIIWGTIPLMLRSIDGAAGIKVFWRVTFGLLAMSIQVACSGQWHNLFKFDRRTTIALTVQGLILGINWALFLGAFELADVAVVELLGYLGPGLVALLAPFMIKEKFDKRIIVPIILSLLGLTVVMTAQGIGGGRNQLLGAGMSLASALTYAYLMVRGKRLVHNIKTTILLWYEVFGATLILLPLGIYCYATGGAPAPTLHNYGLLIVLGFVHTAFASWLFYLGLERLRADQSAIFTYAEPISAVLFAAAFMNETLTLPTIIGGILVIIGGTLVARNDAARGFEMGGMQSPTYTEDTLPPEPGESLDSSKASPVRAKECVHD
jgi:drug/metabolite transporter (DMT)-like permease